VIRVGEAEDHIVHVVARWRCPVRLSRLSPDDCV
jgi:hypothetical protein